jgi:hypothetical protein
MRIELSIQPEAFAFEAEPGEFEAWQAEAPALRPPTQNRGSADYIRWQQSALIRSLASTLRSTAGWDRRRAAQSAAFSRSKD